MRISTKVILNIETNEVLYRESYEYSGPVAQCKSSGDESAILNQQKSFFTQLQSAYSQRFADQSAVLGSIKSAFSPILAAGVGQFGFTPEETAALRTTATENIAGNYKNAATAVRETMAAQGGGNAFLPSGARVQAEEELASTAAGKQADTQNAITQAGYAQGQRNFDAAASVLGGVASADNPLGFAGATTQGGADAFDSASKIAQQNDIWPIVTSVISGASQGVGAAYGAKGKP
jgi:hypothetical protein